LGALLRESATHLRALGADGSLNKRLAEQMAFVVGNRPSPGEMHSWEASLPALAQELIECGLGDLEVLVEYQLPFTSKRMDAVLCGTHPKTGRPSIVVVELKQWTSAQAVDGTSDLVLLGAYGNQPQLHPGVQVRQYCEQFEDLNRFFENTEAHLSGAAYLHNWLSPKNEAIQGFQESERSRVFTAAEKDSWRDFLRAHLSTKESSSVATALLNGKLAPTKQLMDLAAKEILEREQFVLLDEQQVAYSLVMKAVRESQQSNSKTAVIVTGGPGTGKSVIALSLVGELSRQGRSVLHATGSRAFRNSLKKIAGARNPRVQKLFAYFNTFMTSEPNSLDVLVCDEAHRIRTTSANRYTKAANRTGKPQVEELLRAARVPVFLLDAHQVVRKGEIGTPEFIEEAAEKLGIKTTRVVLDGQFRCGGSRSYENWILGLLELDDTPKSEWIPDGNFELRSASSPEELEAFLAAKNAEGYKARITAGFCWTWHDPNSDGTLPMDVQIGDWHKPWNVKGDRGVGGYLSGELWAIDPKGFDQIGCIYTAQGFEYDWNGVIFGPDLVWRTDRWVGDRSGSKDPDMRGVAEDTFQQLVRNTYKVLLTRGLVGSVIYSVDPETQRHLLELAGSSSDRKFLAITNEMGI